MNQKFTRLINLIEKRKEIGTRPHVKGTESMNNYVEYMRLGDFVPMLETKGA